jgi:hypothetical protein
MATRIPTLAGDDVLQAYQLNSALRRQGQPSGREQWARALMMKGADTSPVRSPLEGLARMLTAGVGGYFAGQDRRAGEESEQQMLADMLGKRSQQQSEEQRQLASAGVPGFSMPMPQVQPGVARPQPMAAPGGEVTEPAGMLVPPPTPAPAPVDANLIQALSAMAAGGNKTAAGAMPGVQFQYADAEAKRREQRAEELALAREARADARANRETFAAPVLLQGPNGPVLAQIGNRGTVRPLDGYQPQPEAPPTPFAGNSVEAQALSIILSPGADRSSPVYAAAYQKLYGPRTIVGADGVATTIRPEPPAGILPPVQGAAAPPPIAAAPSAPGVPSTETPVPGATVTRTGAGREATLTESQSKSNMFGLAMLQANRILEKLKDPPSSAVIAAWRNLPEGAFNIALSGENQQYFNALRQFAAGVLRKETGAAFTANELLDVQSRFFAMPGDRPEVLAQKAEARKQAIETMRAELPGQQWRGQIAPPPGVPLPGGNLTAEPPPAGVARPQSEAEFNALPSGTPYQAPDGSMRRKP